MTDVRYDRAPGDIPTEEMQAWTPSKALIYTIGLLVAFILTATSFWVANTSLLWPGGVGLGLAVPRDCPDGHSPGVFPAHDYRAGQHQQHTGACLRPAHRIRGGRRDNVDYSRSERQHVDAVDDSIKHTDAEP
jgi:hypothetical protein